MADKKITQLATGAPLVTDLVPYVANPGSAPATQAATVGNLLTAGYGWVPDPNTWTYVTANSMTCPGDQTGTGICTIGAKIKLANSGAKYFSVMAASYSAGSGLTTLAITGGSDYALANSSITAVNYSLVANPQGFPQWFNWSPSFTGFSVNPAGTHNFSVSGRTVTVNIYETSGTSNATTLTISLPIAPADNQWIVIIPYDNGALQSNPGLLVLAAGNATANAYKTLLVGAWTNIGSKYIYGSFSYRI